MPKILIIDDEKNIRITLREILSHENYDVGLAENGKVALKLIQKETYDVILCDIKMPIMDGIEVLEKLNETTPETPVIMISGHGTIDTAVKAIKIGAFDYIEKPLDLNRVLITLRNALDKSNLIVKNKTLKQQISKNYQMVGNSPAMQKINSMIDQVAKTNARILITGPNGSGKELVAHHIHKKSLRSQYPFIEVNCAAIPSELIESELFGHEKGSFTSAHKQRKGKFELANNGTLFLDEIGDMSHNAQAKVLRTLQENKITPVGGEKEISVDVRIIAATNKNLIEEIRKKIFREDLYHRLSVIIIDVPPLNDRLDDIPLLVDHFVKICSKEMNTQAKKIDDEAISELQNKTWKGNIRELKNIVERLLILVNEPVIDKSHIKQFCQ